MLPHHWLGTLDYPQGLQQQEQLHQQIRAQQAPEQILHLQHQPVYTIGRTQDQSSLQAAEHLPHPVHIISRGGQATYHGPGQLVSYPLINLDNKGRDLHAYLRALEQAMIDANQELGLRSQRVQGKTGIWVTPTQKLASIGVGVRRWVTTHGLALNVTNQSLSGFAHITPCGIDGIRMTSLEEHGIHLSVQQYADILHPHLNHQIQSLQTHTP